MKPTQFFQLVENQIPTDAEKLQLGAELAAYFRDQAHDSGQPLEELGWGLDTPEQIAAAEQERPSLEQTKLLARAFMVGEGETYENPDIAGRIAQLFPEEVPEGHMDAYDNY